MRPTDFFQLIPGAILIAISVRYLIVGEPMRAIYPAALALVGAAVVGWFAWRRRRAATPRSKRRGVSYPVQGVLMFGAVGLGLLGWGVLILTDHLAGAAYNVVLFFLAALSSFWFAWGLWRDHRSSR